MSPFIILCSHVILFVGTNRIAGTFGSSTFLKKITGCTSGSITDSVVANYKYLFVRFFRHASYAPRGHRGFVAGYITYGIHRFLFFFKHVFFFRFLTRRWMRNTCRISDQCLIVDLKKITLDFAKLKTEVVISIPVALEVKND